MMNISFIVFLFFFSQDSVPFKEKIDFEIKFDLSFKQRTQTDATKTVRLDETRNERDRRTNTSQLPYLKLHVKIIIAQANEIKLKVFNDDNSAVLNKKVTEGMEFKLELGFTDDIKDGISGFKHVIKFYSADKDVVSKIVIEFDKEGNYFVNGEKRGKI